MIDLYFWPTGNGKKTVILLEELGLPYTIKPINIGRGDQLTPDFLKISPNGRMPAIVDHEPMGGGAPISIFESGPIMMYLAEKTGRFWPQDPRQQIRGRPMGRLAIGESGSQARRARPFSTCGRERQQWRSILRPSAL
jgi:GST-like protein